MGDWVSASLGRPSNDSPGLVAGRGMAAQPGWMAAQATGELVPTQHLDQCTRGPLEVRPLLQHATAQSSLLVGNTIGERVKYMGLLQMSFIGISEP